MPTALENAIAALSEPEVSLPDALRRLLVVGRRIGADQLTGWLRGELNGYPGDGTVPGYRGGQHLPLKLQFDGPMHASSSIVVTAAELPDELSGVMSGMDFREPVAELDALCAGAEDPQLALPLAWVSRYRNLAAKESVPSIQFFILNRAGVMMPRTHLRGILDRVKSTALDLALSLEDVSPEVGAAGGPTVADDPRLAHEVQLHLTQLFASDSTITIGDNATVASGSDAIAVSLKEGDTEGLLRAAGEILDSDGVQALTDALSDDGGRPAEETRRFLSRVKGGAYFLVGGVGTNAAYDGILQLIQQVFPGALS